MSEISSYSQMQKDFVKWLKNENILETKELRKVDVKTATTKYEKEFKEFLAQYKVHEQDFQVNMIDIEKEYTDSLDKENEKKHPLMEMFNDIMSKLKGNKEIYQKVDVNKDGQISKEEASNFFKSIAGFDGNDKSVSLTDLLEATDVDKDNKINFTSETLTELEKYAIPEEAETIEGMDAMDSMGAMGSAGGGGNSYVSSSGSSDVPATAEGENDSVVDVNLEASTVEEIDEQIKTATDNKNLIEANLDACVETDNAQKEVISQEEAALADSVSKVEGLEVSLSDVKHKISINEKGISKNQKGIQDQTKVLQSANDGLNDTRAQLSSLKAPNRGQFTYKDEDGKEKFDSAGYDSAMSEYNNTKHQLEEQSRAYMKQIEDAKARISELEAVLQKLYTEKVELYSEQTNIIAEKTGAESEVTMLSSNLTDHVAENAGTALLRDILVGEEAIQNASITYLENKKDSIQQNEEQTNSTEEVEELDDTDAVG